MNIAPEELTKLCHGCDVPIKYSTCWLKKEIVRWPKACPCCGCFINPICCDPCDKLKSFSRMLLYWRGPNEFNPR